MISLFSTSLYPFSVYTVSITWSCIKIALFFNVFHRIQTQLVKQIFTSHSHLCYVKPLQVGDVAVLDISATTIEQDESAAKRIPSADSKGLHDNLVILSVSVII